MFKEHGHDGYETKKNSYRQLDFVQNFFPGHCVMRHHYAVCILQAVSWLDGLPAGDLVSSTLAKISGLSRNNGLIANYNELILDTLHFRGVVGSESSMSYLPT
jgi:hypothetical protein